MGISSQAISVKSSINLSDINIDSDLDLGTNNLLLNGVNINSIFSMATYKYQYGKSVFNRTKLETPTLLFTDTTTYSNGSGGVYKLVNTYSDMQTLTSITDKLVKVSYQLTHKNSTIPSSYSRAHIGKLGNESDLACNNATTDWVTFGNNNTFIYNQLYLPTDTVKIGLKQSSGTSYVKDISLWITETYDYIPTIINSTWLSAVGFNGIKSITLNAGDTVKLNDSADLIFSGSTGIITQPYISTTWNIFDLTNDYGTITQIETTAGNPIFEFY